jgi:hypothetical protein
MKALIDKLKPRGEVVQVTLKKKGVPVARIYSDDKREFRSPSLDKEDDAQRPS